jgi:hypothetical protein
VSWGEPPGVSVEVRWHPEQRETLGLVCPLHVKPEAISQFVALGRKRLQDVERRGRRRGPDGFKDAQEFEDTLVHLIQVAYAKGQGTTQKRIAGFLQPELRTRRGDSDSAASVDVDIDSTIRYIKKHISIPWRDLVRKALQSL